MPGEEPGRVVHLEPRDTGVPAQIGVQRLLPGAGGVEQVQGRLPFRPFVVPLQQELQRNGDLPGRLGQGVGYETPAGETAAEMRGSTTASRMPMVVIPSYPPGRRSWAAKGGRPGWSAIPGPLFRPAER